MASAGPIHPNGSEFYAHNHSAIPPATILGFDGVEPLFFSESTMTPSNASHVLSDIPHPFWYDREQYADASSTPAPVPYASMPPPNPLFDMINGDDYETLYRATFHDTFTVMYRAIYDSLNASTHATHATHTSGHVPASAPRDPADDERYIMHYNSTVADLDGDAERAGGFDGQCTDGVGWVAKDCTMMGDVANWLCPGCDMLMPPRGIKAASMKCPLCSAAFGVQWRRVKNASFEKAVVFTAE